MEKLMAKAQIETGETVETAGKDITWLRVLEEKVHAAAGRILELREENAGLRRRIEELEARLAAPASDGADRWTEEREEIRGRVARLVEHLEELL
jgi:BMFP domain-containing protein YqiC